MKISTDQPYEIIYSLYEHEYLGYLIDSYAIQLDDKGLHTFQHQNISISNAKDFDERLDETDYEIIRLTDEIHQNAITKKYSKKPIKPDDFFLKIYHKNKGDLLIQYEIKGYIERRIVKILSLLSSKRLFETGSDGEPTYKEIEVQDNPATVLFHFRKNEENTHYFPTIKHDGAKVDFQYKNGILICNDPAWLLVNGKLYHFEKQVDGNKLKPFLNKKFIQINKSAEEKYYKGFIVKLISSYDVHAKGFDIITENHNPVPIVSFSEFSTNGGNTLSLFGEKSEATKDEGKIIFSLSYQYGSHLYKADYRQEVNVKMKKTEEERYVFHRIKRNLAIEKKQRGSFESDGLRFVNAKAVLPKPVAFDWLHRYKKQYEDEGVVFQQKSINGKSYFVGKPTIDIQINEKIDWFDIKALIKFGDHEILFRDLKKYITSNKSEFKLPNGEYAVIPQSWFSKYGDVLSFINEDGNNHTLKKHHITLVQTLHEDKLAKVTLSKRLQKLRNFDDIVDVEIPKSFNGELRPYQQAGYNWLHFLHEYNFGGCLADDMGLGKTVQTLAFILSIKEMGKAGTNLLVMPTSLIYNWQVEAQKFTPSLKVVVYSGTNRQKNVERFAQYDIVITTYGVARIDIELLKQFNFQYVILDESQAIKNPTARTSIALRNINSVYKLVLSGTPIENSTMDLWSQMSFINDGLLGSQVFFKKKFQLPIEKKNDENKKKKLYSLIKPFILRRHKSQVATDLPAKIENVQYCIMTEEQQKVYDKTKEYYRGAILDSIKYKGMGKSNMILLEGLTKLRQIANHPYMVDKGYDDDSGKMRDVMHMLDEAISKGHKILMFSQFVKHLALLEDALNEKNIDYAYLDGATTNRQQQVERFQNDDKLQLFLISLKAGGLGLNLTKADYVFILDPWWNPAVEAQAEDRAHRIGQKNTVFTYKFISQDTVEEKILTLQQRKLALATELISTEESFIKKLSKEDIENILM